jgi:Arc/MetJ-type ribon-helix-helix transcriptional regulator
VEELERIIIAMPGELVAVIEAAIGEGDYASTSATGRSSVPFSTRKLQASGPTSTKGWLMLRVAG